MELVRRSPDEFAASLRNLVIHMPGVAASQYLPLLDVTVWEVSGQFVGLHGGTEKAPTAHFWNVE